MKILFLDAYYEPEQIAFTHLENDLIEGLVQAGHDIVIVCPTPTRGVNPTVIKDYKKKKRETKYDGHVQVIRFSAPQEKNNPLFRALRYFWCNFRSFQIGKKMKNIDVVFSNSTPPTQGWISGRVAKKLNKPFVYSLQDVFPDSLVTAGLTQEKSLLWWVGRKLENLTYNSCSKIIVISESMKNNLVHKGVDEKQIQLIPNWIDLNEIHPVSKVDNVLFDEFGISREKYIVLYAGNFGSAQGAEIVLDAAEQLQDNTKIQFVIFGGGSGYSTAEMRSKSLSNVFFHPLLSLDHISEVYSMGDVALITCKKGVGKSGMPSKTWSIMACNTPIIASFDTDSELTAIINDSNAGYVVPPEDVDKLVSAIALSLQSDINTSHLRSYVNKLASKEYCVNEYINAIIF